MGLFQRLSHDLRAGWVTVRQGTAQVATRAMEEGELLRYRVELRKLDQQLDDLHADIGERTIELHERGDSLDRILTDGEVVRLLAQVKALQEERTKLLLEMNDIAIDGP